MSVEPDKPKDAINWTDEKARLECEKIKAEVDEKRRSLWKTPAFYTALSPVLLALLGVVWSWSSGWFDAQRTRITNEKTLLEAQTERLKIDRTGLDAEVKQQRTHVLEIETELSKLREDRSSLTNQIVLLQRERDEIRQAKELFESEAKRLAEADTNAARTLTELTNMQKSRELMLGQIDNLRWEAETYMQLASNYLRTVRQAQKVIRTATKTAMKDVTTHRQFADFIGEAIEFDVATMAVLPEWQVEIDPQTPAARSLWEAVRRIESLQARTVSNKPGVNSGPH